jgi:hypothetical protein
MFGKTIMPFRQTADNVVYGLCLLILPGLNLKFGVAVVRAAAHVVVCRHKVVAELVLMLVKLFA